jgi:ribonuclease Y
VATLLGILAGLLVGVGAAYAALRARTAAPPATGAAPAPSTAGTDPGRAAETAAAHAAANAAAEARAADTLARAEADAAAIRAAAETAAAALRQNAEAAVAAANATAATAASTAAAEARAQVEADARAAKADLDRREERLVDREQRLAEREERLDAEQRRVEARDRALAEAEADLNRKTAELKDVEEERRLILERTAGMTAADAKAELVASMENQAKRDAVAIVRDIEKQAQDTGEERARKIVTLAIQRVASDQTAESVVSVLHLPSDDMKGRIIGREGRNIRAYESITGVNLIIDDTPEAVLLSCFDPVRREIGRLTLDKLVLDGRIHPQRIEEMYERSKEEVAQLVTRAGEDALYEVGITEMHPEIVNLLGRLKYRTSYGQNVLRHLVEAAHIAGVMAAELKLDIALVKRCTVLHDLGKALTHEVEGSHALIGAEIARKYGESEDVAHAIEAHHGEVEQRTVEAVLTQSADAISGGRPGARRESLESYVKRLERLEEIATSKPGVEKVFAMQAGREVRVMVLPDQVDDIQAQVIARDIAKQVEEELTYPGQIRVTVVRESRATEYAK